MSEAVVLRCVYCGARAVEDPHGHLTWMVGLKSSQLGCDHETIDGRT